MNAGDARVRIAAGWGAATRERGFCAAQIFCSNAFVRGRVDSPIARPDLPQMD